MSNRGLVKSFVPCVAWVARGSLDGGCGRTPHYILLTLFLYLNECLGDVEDS